MFLLSCCQIIENKLTAIFRSDSTLTIFLSVPGADPKGGATGPWPPQTMVEKLKLSCRAYMLVLQIPLMTIKQLINIAV